VSQIKRKEPGIQQLAKKYNELCAELEAMIKKKQAPRGARAPHSIASDGLFKLDVDDDIWQDVGLDESDISSTGEMP
jgi:chaperonin cofactor prefoldin